MHLRCLLVVAAATGLSGCATLVDGANQNISVLTQPPGAACALQREGNTLAVVNPTPGTARVSKSRHDIMVACTLAGYQPSAAALSPSFRATTLGNVIAGGVVGIAVDAASGASNLYPDNVTVAMIPAGPQAAAVDSTGLALFETNRRAAERIDAIRTACRPRDRARCAAEVAAEEQQRDLELARIEAGRGRMMPGL